MTWGNHTSARVPFASRWSAAEIQNSFIRPLRVPIQTPSDVDLGLLPHLNFSTQAAISNSLNATSDEMLQNLKRFVILVPVSSDISAAVIPSQNFSLDAAAFIQDPEGVQGPVNLTTYTIIKTGLFINNPNSYGATSGSNGSSTSTERLTMTGLANWNPGFSSTFWNSSTLLFSMQAMWSELDDSYRYSDWEFAGINASECGLYLCVKEYNTTINNSVISESSREVASTREIHSYHSAEDPPETELTIQNLQNFSSKRTDLQILPPDGSLSSHTEVFNISQAGVCGLSYYLNKAFDDGTLEQNWRENGEDVFLPVLPHVSGLVKLLPNSHDFQFLPNSMEVLWQDRASGFDTVFESVATSLTNNIRMTADGGTTMPGIQGTSLTVVKVRWPWIILPSVTVIVGVLFLIISIMQTHKTQLPLWKESDLGSWFHGPDDDFRKTLRQGTVTKASEIEVRAKRIKAISFKNDLSLRKSTSKDRSKRPSLNLLLGIDEHVGRDEDGGASQGADRDDVALLPLAVPDVVR
ncbi:MAG: hypothetical protein M1820_006391 [Bogoriella megaspora]|nr:MAG: hypothetical protein M1820_006391 [Bogoriella megaspora]